MSDRSALHRYALTLMTILLAVGLFHWVPIAEAASAEGPASKKAGLTKSKSAEYWFRKGSLCATYGNDLAAVAYFKKAITLDPRDKRAYFSQGVSYGQLGQYTQALAAIDRAIELDPDNGLFYYGRGRVQLLAGNQDSATNDFKKAAELGDEDAQLYLGEIKAPEALKLE
jgi:tetratricopeptide (TPR) repeat protein